MQARNLLLAGVATLAIAFAATDTFAQFGGRGGTGGMMGGSRGGGNRDQSNNHDSRNNRSAQPAVDSYEQTEYRLSLMEEDLHLQPDQRLLWDSFANKVRAYASDLARARARAMTPPSADGGAAGGVQFVEQTADEARNRATALDDIAIAAKSLYSGLAPNQKVLADARIVTLVAPQSRASPGADNVSNLPDLGSSVRQQR